MSCQQITNGINAQCDTATGGVVKVMIANRGDLEKFSDLATWLNADWYQFTFRKQAVSMTSTATVDDANGVVFTTTELVLQFPRMDAAKRIAINALLQSDVKVCVKDADGYWHLLGEKEPVTVTAGDGQTGTARGDANRYSITLQDLYPNGFPQVFDVAKDIADFDAAYESALA